MLQETAKRQLQFTVPRVVAVSPQMRLVEDSPSSLSLLDIYKKVMKRYGVYHSNETAIKRVRFHEMVVLGNVKKKGNDNFF